MTSRKGVSAAFAVLLLIGLLPAAAPPVGAAGPVEPTAQVTVYPNDPTIDASGLNPVDTTFMVNVTGTNNRPFQEYMMWVNISFASSSGWKVNPTVANITLTLPAMDTATKSVSVTVTVPPKVSANNISTFSAAWTRETNVPLPQQMSGNATAQIHIRQIFSTTAEFANGTSQYTVRQGQDTNISMRVTNRGNGDALYDAELRNAAELRPSDILVKSTVGATVALNGTGFVTMVIHANPYAIAGSYQLQIRLLASGAGVPPPAGAFADLTAQLIVTASATPPPQNNTTVPPPPPPPPPPDVLQTLINSLSTPAGLIGVSIVGVAGALGIFASRRSKALKRQRQEALAKARERRAGPGAPRPVGAPGAPGAPRPGMQGAPRPGAPRPGAPGGPPVPQRPGQRMPARPGAPTPRPQAPPPK